MFGLEGSGFIISLAVTLLLCGVVAYYAKSQFSTMEHKITSMFELVSSLAGQVNELNKTIILSKNNNQTHGIKLNENNVDNRILVSDSEPDSDSESESTTESDSESNIHIDNESIKNNTLDDDNNIEQSIINLDSHNLKMGSELNQIKVVELNIDDENEINDNIENLNLTKQSNDHKDSNSESETEEDSSSESDDNSINESIDELALTLEPENIVDISNSNVENSNILKLEDNESLSNEKNIDYKKLQVKVLRELVKEKGLSTNPSKINKKDLVKLLES